MPETRPDNRIDPLKVARAGNRQRARTLQLQSEALKISRQVAGKLERNVDFLVPILP